MKRERGAGGLTNEGGPSAGPERGKSDPLLFFVLRTSLPQANWRISLRTGTRYPSVFSADVQSGSSNGSEGRTGTLSMIHALHGGPPALAPRPGNHSCCAPDMAAGGVSEPTPDRLSVAEPRPTKPSEHARPLGNPWFPRVQRRESGSQTLAGMADRATRPRNRHRPLPLKKPSLYSTTPRSEVQRTLYV